MKPIGEMFGTLLVVLFEKGLLNNADLKRITGVDFRKFTREVIKRLKR